MVPLLWISLKQWMRLVQCTAIKTHRTHETIIFDVIKYGQIMSWSNLCLELVSSSRVHWSFELSESSLQWFETVRECCNHIFTNSIIWRRKKWSRILSFRVVIISFSRSVLPVESVQPVDTTISRWRIGNVRMLQSNKTCYSLHASGLLIWFWIYGYQSYGSTCGFLMLVNFHLQIDFATSYSCCLFRFFFHRCFYLFRWFFSAHFFGPTRLFVFFPQDFCLIFFIIFFS